MGFILMIILMLGSFSSVALACNPNEDCTVSSFLGSFDDPVCLARKTVCRTQCGNINADAEKYILNSQTEIRRSEDMILNYRDDIGQSREDLEIVESRIGLVQQLQFSAQTMVQESENLLTSQSKIQEFVRQTRLENPAGLINVQNVENLIKLNSANIEIVQFLNMYALVLSQDEEVATAILDPNLMEPVILIKKLLGKTLDSFARLEGEGSEERLNHIEKITSKKSQIRIEFENIENQEANIEDQEARKCSTIL